MMLCIQGINKPIGKDNEYIELSEDDNGNVLLKKVKKKKLKSSKILIKTSGLLILLTIILISSVYAEKVDSDININVQCANSTYSNITSVIYKTNSTYILKGEYGMTKSGTNYNYTLNSTLNNMIGTLEVNYHCNVNGIDTTAGYLIEVTPTGYEVSIPQTTVMFFIVGIVSLVGLLFFIFGIKTEVPYIRIFCLSISVILIVFLIGYIMNIANLTIGGFTDLTNGFTPIYIIFISLLSVGGFGLVVYLIVFGLQAFAKHRGFKD